MVTERNPRARHCPAGHEAPPCPLYGGTMPPLEWDDPSGDEVLSDERGPETSDHRRGTCAVCSAELTTDHEGVAVLDVVPRPD